MDPAVGIAIVLGLAAAFWVGHAWILLLSARIFADVDIGWGRSLLAALVGTLVQLCAGTILTMVVFADGEGVSPLESIAATAIGWLVWGIAISAVTGLDPKATLLTALGMVGVTAAFGFAVQAGVTIGWFT